MRTVMQFPCKTSEISVASETRMLEQIHIINRHFLLFFLLLVQGAVPGVDPPHPAEHGSCVPHGRQVHLRGAHLLVRLPAQQLHLARGPGDRPLAADLRGADGTVQGPPEARDGGVCVQHLSPHVGE